jgi:starch synthase
VLTLWQQPKLLRLLALNGVAWDYSWSHPGQHYLNIDEYIRHKWNPGPGACGIESEE